MSGKVVSLNGPRLPGWNPLGWTAPAAVSAASVERTKVE